jgi:hypothetical protein
MISSNPGRGEVFRTRLDCSWSPPSPLSNGLQFISGVLQPEHGFNLPPPSTDEVRGTVELYVNSPFVSSWQVIGEIQVFGLFKDAGFFN